MEKVKKTGIIAGAIVGGTIGGLISVIGKVSKVKIIDDIGESVVDSTILSGTIAGNAASGAADIITGATLNNPQKKEEGIKDLKITGGQLINNFTNNIKLVAVSGSEIFTGIKNRNTKEMKHGIKSLVKVAAVGFITVGPIKIKDDPSGSQKE